MIFNRELYLARQKSARGEAMHLLDQRVADELQDRLAVINHQFERVLLIAPRAQPFAAVLAASGKTGTITQLSPQVADNLSLPHGQYDAAVSLMDLHTVNDVPGYLAQVSACLKPDGLAMFAFCAGDTLRELRQAWLAAETATTGGVSPRVAPMIDLREAGGLLQRAGLALPVADMDHMTLRYADALSLMREVKALGFANALIGRNRNVVSRRLMLAVFDAYAAEHVDADGRIRATLDIAWAMAWKPHPSQQQPLKPGSAKARLADALKIKPGD